MKWHLGYNIFFMVCLGMIEWIRVILKMRLLGAIQACHVLMIDSMETKKKNYRLKKKTTYQKILYQPIG